jgi:RimJ/RimL family protein N-acetyltransferase
MRVTADPVRKDDDIRDPDDQYGAAKAARVSSQRPRCLCRHAGKPEVMRFLVDGRTHTRVEVWRIMTGSLGSWPLRGYGMWAWVKADTGRFVGSIGIFQPLDWPEPELAYSLDRPFWGQGFATEAATAARDWLFSHFPLPRLASFIRPGNHTSIHVAERSAQFVKVQSSCEAPQWSIGSITGRDALIAWNKMRAGLTSDVKSASRSALMENHLPASIVQLPDRASEGMPFLGSGRIAPC